MPLIVVRKDFAVLVLSRRVLPPLLVVGLAMQFFGSARTNPAPDPDRDIRRTVSVPPYADAILTRACRNCHSNDTTWPWYSYVAPASWLVVAHVNQGREHMNLSQWPDQPEDAADLLGTLCEEVREGRMPVPSYTWVHGEARLSDAERTRLCDWANQAAAQLER
ncbi:MAG TPA: heme-binding domain-containing protein [Vicinamibacterales bacterium]|nr:heme-binding domain-containing protein [Vicinamibacterales bacterium]